MAFKCSRRFCHKRLPLSYQIRAELNGAQLEIVVDLLLAPPRQKFQEVKLFFKKFLVKVFHVEHRKVGTILALEKRFQK